jgi:hypothetical protein
LGVGMLGLGIVGVGMLGGFAHGTLIVGGV